jgi:RNA polymerase sigma-70 factor, ECF subfamily
MSSSPSTTVLNRAGDGDVSARRRVWELVQDELHRAARRLVRGRDRATLRPTDLVNEAYLRLFGKQPKHWRDRKHFFRFAAFAMRNVVLDHAKRHKPAQREDSLDSIPELESAAAALDFDALGLALDEFAKDPANERAHEIVHQRFFLSMTIASIAELHGVSTSTVHDELEWAIACLKRDLARRQR